MGALALGTDGGGSVRIPAGFTGVVGMKATFGRVPAYPLSPFGTVANVGPMARSVTDAALLLTVMGEPDPRAAYPQIGSVSCRASVVQDVLFSGVAATVNKKNTNT